MTKTRSGMKAGMKAMICEMCGGNEVVKTGGMYVCQYCGTKYDVEEARKLIVEISGPVAVDGIATVDNLMERAQEFLDKGDERKALEYVERVLDIDAHHERARAMQTAIQRAEMHGALGQMPPEATRVPATQSAIVNGASQTVSLQQYVSPHTNITAVGQVALATDMPSSKSKTTTLLLCIFFGWFGVHCFYAGRPGRGILFLFTYGLFGIGWIWDIIVIACGKFKDGKKLCITQ